MCAARDSTAHKRFPGWIAIVGTGFALILFLLALSGCATVRDQGNTRPVATGGQDQVRVRGQNPGREYPVRGTFTTRIAALGGLPALALAESAGALAPDGSVMGGNPGLFAPLVSPVDPAVAQPSVSVAAPVPDPRGLGSIHKPPCQSPGRSCGGSGRYSGGPRRDTDSWCRGSSPTRSEFDRTKSPEGHGPGQRGAEIRLSRYPFRPGKAIPRPLRHREEHDRFLFPWLVNLIFEDRWLLAETRPSERRSGTRCEAG